MSEQRTAHRKAAVTIAACCVAWVAGSTLVYTSGGLNPVGLVPSLGCAIALWGAVRSDTGPMWLGTAVVVVSAVAFVFSIGLVLAPAAVVLVIGSLVLARGQRVSA